MGTFQTPPRVTDDLVTSSLSLILAERITLPLPPTLELEARFEMEIYARFMRHLREVPNSRQEIKILSAIQFTADMMDVSDALVAKTLVDLGLRAPRHAFPPAFLDFCDRALQRTAWDNGNPQSSILSLRDHWERIGESRFAGALPGAFALNNRHHAAV